MDCTDLAGKQIIPPVFICEGGGFESGARAGNEVQAAISEVGHLGRVCSRDQNSQTAALMRTARGGLFILAGTMDKKPTTHV